MCTLIALHHLVPGFPLIVAMNRDEFLDRPSISPSLRSGPPRIVAPRDARAEGTWIGVNEHGLLAAVSNRFVGPPDLDARSRGLLCLESLAKQDATEAAMFVGGAVEEHVYNPFNMLHADRERVVCTSREGTTWAHHGVAGVNVLTNGGLNVEDPRESRVRALLKGRDSGRLESAIAAMRTALADHEDAAGRAICHHGRETGTVSQTIIALADRGWRQTRLWYGEGPSCTAELVDYSRAFRE